MVLRHANAERGRDHGIDALGHAFRDDLRTEGVGADEPQGTMLLGRADGDDDAPRAFEVGIDFLPGGELQQHVGFSR